MIRPLICRGLLHLALALPFVACAGDPALPPDLLTRETFVDVYVALRMEALRSPSAEIDEEARLRIMEEFQVDEEDLIAFAEAHGSDPAYMLEVWREIEERLNVPVDSTAADSN